MLVRNDIRILMVRLVLVGPNHTMGYSQTRILGQPTTHRRTLLFSLRNKIWQRGLH